MLRWTKALFITVRKKNRKKTNTVFAKPDKACLWWLVACLWWRDILHHTETSVSAEENKTRCYWPVMNTWKRYIYEENQTCKRCKTVPGAMKLPWTCGSLKRRLPVLPFSLFVPCVLPWSIKHKQNYQVQRWLNQGKLLSVSTGLTTSWKWETFSTIHARIQLKWQMFSSLEIITLFLITNMCLFYNNFVFHPTCFCAAVNHLDFYLFLILSYLFQMECRITCWTWCW